MEKQIKFITLEYKDTSSDLIENSFAIFKNIDKVNYKNIKKIDNNYLAIHLRQPFDIKLVIDSIPNDIFLLMQQGIIKPLIIMTTEQWDLFDTYAWRSNRHNLTPDFGNIPYSSLIKHFTNRSVPEENITWVVPDENYVLDIQFLKNKGYKISCRFLQLDCFLELMKTVALNYKIKEKKFKKHYSSLCGGTPRNHRYGITYNLWQSNLWSKGNVSCGTYKELIETKNSNWIDDAISSDAFMSGFQNWDENKDAFTKLLPLVFDNIYNSHWSINEYDESKIFENSFLWIASETKKTHNGVYITEKTWKAIAYGSPFCINGDSGSLQYLKKLGFKTFEKFWDESYDSDNDIEKIEKITKIIKNICNKNLEELNELYVEMMPTLKYNQEHLQTYPQYDNLIKALKNGQ
jgi:hypothetical protein